MHLLSIALEVLLRFRIELYLPWTSICLLLPSNPQGHGALAHAPIISRANAYCRQVQRENAGSGSEKNCAKLLAGLIAIVQDEVGGGDVRINVPLTQPITLPRLDCNEVPFILQREEELCIRVWPVGTSSYNCAVVC